MRLFERKSRRSYSDSTMSHEYYAGIDIGGTKISVLITDQAGQILGRAKKKSRAERGFEVVMDRTLECVETSLKEAGLKLKDLRAAGVGAPSPILPDGTAVAAPNMGWKDAPLGASLQQRLNLPIFADNDCNIGTFGEFAARTRSAAMKKSDSLVGLFMGTGLGGGMVINGELIQGDNCLAAEVGHMTIKVDGRLCGCGKKGCVEAYASKRGMGYAFKRAILLEGRTSILPELLEPGASLDNVKSSILKKAWDEKDELTRHTLKQAARYLGIAAGNLITLLGPHTIVLGGGVLDALGNELIPLVQEAAVEATFPRRSAEDCSIELALLGDDAVALGAMEFAKKQSH